MARDKIMNDYKFYWAYRYADTDEPALVLLADSIFNNNHMAYLAGTSPWRIRKKTSMLSTRISECELDVWRVFELCPVIRVEENKETAKFMYNTTQTTI